MPCQTGNGLRGGREILVTAASGPRPPAACRSGRTDALAGQSIVTVSAL